jgi:hypothetical protein
MFFGIMIVHLQLNHYRSSRWAFTFFIDKKVNKKSSQNNASSRWPSPTPLFWRAYASALIK